MRRSGPKIMMKLIGLVTPLMPVMLLAIILGVLGFLCAMLITILGGYAILSVLSIDTGLRLNIVNYLIVFAVLRGALHYGEQTCNHYIAFKLLALIRDKVFRALRKLAPAKLEGRDKGNLISILTSDIELLEVFYAHTISPIAIAIIVSALMAALIGRYHILLSCIACIGYIVVGVIIPLIASRRNMKASTGYRSDFGDMNSYLLDSLRGLKEIIQYQAGASRLDQIDKGTSEMGKKEKRSKENGSVNSANTGAAIILFSVVMLSVSSLLYLSGDVQFDGVLIPTIVMMSSFGPVTALANLGTGLSQTLAAGDRVIDILEESPVTLDITGKEEITFEGAALDNVSFAYEKEDVLSNININIAKGGITGISGKSGSGKSTILRLLMRFWDTDEGMVKISERDIREVNTLNLRQMEGFVTQETQLLSDTIENNIKIAKLDATHEEVVEACKRAAIHDFIVTLPEGYETKVGELGGKLSGGERQRVGIARVFLHRAQLILLDEPTSNLDSLNEAVVLKSLCSDSEGKTIVLVSHRQSTMKIADKVYCLEGDRIS